MVLGPETAVRIGHGTVLCVISPLLGHIVDLRHQSHYGTVYGLYTASYNLGLSVGKSWGMGKGRQVVIVGLCYFPLNLC